MHIIANTNAKNIKIDETEIEKTIFINIKT